MTVPDAGAVQLMTRRGDEAPAGARAIVTTGGGGGAVAGRAGMVSVNVTLLVPGMMLMPARDTVTVTPVGDADTGTALVISSRSWVPPPEGVEIAFDPDVLPRPPELRV